MKRLISIAGLAVLVFAATVQAQNNDRVTVNLSDPSRPGLLKISLINGSISVKTHTGKDVTVEGRTPGRRGGRQQTPSDGLRRIGGGGGGFAVEEQNNVITISSGTFNFSENLEIEVPVKTNLNLSTINGGAIVVEGVEGDIEVANQNGDIKLVGVSGSVVASAANGNLSALVKELDSKKATSFTSMNSNVDVTLPPSTKANLRIRSDNGDAYSDFDIQLGPSAPPVVTASRPGRPNRIETDKTINGTINGGGATVELRTLNGNIYLRKAK